MLEREQSSEDTDQAKLLIEIQKEERVRTRRVCSLRTDTNTESKTDGTKGTQLDSQADRFQTAPVPLFVVVHFFRGIQPH